MVSTVAKMFTYDRELVILAPVTEKHSPHVQDNYL